MRISSNVHNDDLWAALCLFCNDLKCTNKFCIKYSLRNDICIVQYVSSRLKILAWPLQFFHFHYQYTIFHCPWFSTGSNVSNCSPVTAVEIVRLPTQWLMLLISPDERTVNQKVMLWVNANYELVPIANFYDHSVHVTEFERPVKPLMRRFLKILRPWNPEKNAINFQRNGLIGKMVSRTLPVKKKKQNKKKKKTF